MPDAVGDCEGCTACCSRCGVPPFQSWEELESLPEELRAPILAYWDNVGNGPPPTDAGPCSWLVENVGCAHFEHRPQVCRNFVIDGPLCQWFKGGCVGIPPVEMGR